MSRIGRLPVTVPGSVTVDITGGCVEVKGPKGNLSTRMPDLISAVLEDGNVVLKRANDSRPAKARHGLMRSLVQNMVTGVTEGFKKELEIIGVGYRAEVKGKKLVMQLGYSHPIEYPIPGDVNVKVDRNTSLEVSGADKQKVGQVAADIRDFRSPDSYKGKGIRYKGEYVRLKTGKSA